MFYPVCPIIGIWQYLVDNSFIPMSIFLEAITLELCECVL